MKVKGRKNTSIIRGCRWSRTRDDQAILMTDHSTTTELAVSYRNFLIVLPLPLLRANRSRVSTIQPKAWFPYDRNDRCDHMETRLNRSNANRRAIHQLPGNKIL